MGFSKQLVVPWPDTSCLAVHVFWVHSSFLGSAGAASTSSWNTIANVCTVTLSRPGAIDLSHATYKHHNCIEQQRYIQIYRGESSVVCQHLSLPASLVFPCFHLSLVFCNVLVFLSKRPSPPTRRPAPRRNSSPFTLHRVEIMCPLPSLNSGPGPLVDQLT